MMTPAPELTFGMYHELMAKVTAYPGAGNNIIFPALGLAGETGELVEKVKKLWRDCGVTGFGVAPGCNFHSSPDPLDFARSAKLREDAVKEIGDVLWYLDALATELGVTLEEAARQNVEKLLSREARGTIHGEGDNR